MRRLILSAVLGTTLAAGLAAFTYPGPPGVCHPIECGASAGTLDKAWAGVDGKSLAARLPVALDQFPANTAARMEAVRRAANIDGAKADAVVGALALRALEQQVAESETAPAALFDAGYAVHMFYTLGATSMRDRAATDGVPGYAFVRAAIERDADAGMHVGATYLLLPAAYSRGKGAAKARELYDHHCEAAVKACTPGSVEEKNLAVVMGIEGKKVEALRAKLAKK